MWMLAFIPDDWIRFFIHGIVALGFLMYLGSGFVQVLTRRWLTNVSMAASTIRLIGAVTLLVGVFLEGGYGVEMSWRQRVEEMEQKVHQAEQASARANQSLQDAQVRKVEEIQQITAAVRSQIQNQRTVINNACRLDPVAIDLYNQSIAGPPQRSTPR